ncbi:uncharacterized protein LOC124417324 isoform X2 [Gallus gallus]|uniref:uncharacterized protein LOC124417324 isoform X2 n=1 Tax=Gallus gallus TaxID=9031 RepID=UPI001F004DFC|nr:uncharacterized protein LOC124417324 isoform X2 [Gallus gallus]
MVRTRGRSAPRSGHRAPRHSPPAAAAAAPRAPLSNAALKVFFLPASSLCRSLFFFPLRLLFSSSRPPPLAGDAGCCERRGGRSPCRLIPVRYLCGLRLSLPLSATVPKELCHNEPAHPSPSWAPSGGTFLSELPPVDTHTRLPRQLLRQLQSRKESNKSVQRLSFSKGGGGRSCSLVGRQHLNLREYPRTQTCDSLRAFVLALHPDLALPGWGTQPQRQCPVSTTTSSLHSLLVYSHPCPELPDPSGAVATSTARHLQEAIEQPQSPLSQQQIQSSAKF